MLIEMHACHPPAVIIEVPQTAIPLKVNEGGIAQLPSLQQPRIHAVDLTDVGRLVQVQASKGVLVVEGADLIEGVVALGGRAAC